MYIFISSAKIIIFKYFHSWAETSSSCSSYQYQTIRTWLFPQPSSCFYVWHLKGEIISAFSWCSIYFKMISWTISIPQDNPLCTPPIASRSALDLPSPTSHMALCRLWALRSSIWRLFWKSHVLLEVCSPSSRSSISILGSVDKSVPYFSGRSGSNFRLLLLVYEATSDFLLYDFSS